MGLPKSRKNKYCFQNLVKINATFQIGQSLFSPYVGHLCRELTSDWSMSFNSVSQL